MKRLVCLKTYFGLLSGQTIANFAAECSMLSEADKNELAQGAAQNLGVVIVE